jgi:4-amino-4-deoxy-L-arabinose transferase-like glycosyltransferase
MVSADDAPRRAMLLLALVASLAILPGLGRVSLFEPDEPRFAEATRLMFERGDFLTPRFNGRPRFEKPILLYWMQAPFYALLGPTELAARAPAAVCGVLVVLLLYDLGRRVLGERAGFAGALVLASSFRFVTYARQGLTDVPVLLFEMAALWGFWRAREEGAGTRASRRHAAWAWAAIGAAALTKGPVAALPLLIWVAFLGVTRWLDGVRAMRWWPGAAIALVVAAPWYLYMAAVHGAAYLDHGVGYELVRRYADPQFPGPQRGWLYYMGVWPGDAAPWTLFFLAALAWLALGWRRLDAMQRTGLAFCLTWFAVVLVLFSSATGKLPHYLLPLYPPLALVVGFFADRASGAASGRTAGRPDIAAPRAARVSWSLAAWVTVVALIGAAAIVALFLVRIAGAPAVSPAMLLPAALAAGAAAAAVSEWRGARFSTLRILAGTFVAAYAVLGFHVAPRYLQDMQPIRPIGEAVSRVASPGEPVAHYGSYGGSGLVFYSRHLVEFPGTHAATGEFLRGPGRRFLVISAGDLEGLQPYYDGPLHELARQDVLVVRIKRVMEGRRPDPRRVLLLVSNQP